MRATGHAAYPSEGSERVERADYTLARQRTGKAIRLTAVGQSSRSMGEAPMKSTTSELRHDVELDPTGS
jgi:hypothetical protein